MCKTIEDYTTKTMCQHTVHVMYLVFVNDKQILQKKKGFIPTRCVIVNYRVLFHLFT